MGMKAAFTKVFRNMRYTMFAIAVALTVLFLAIWFPNLRLIAAVVFSPGTSVAEKVALPISLLGSIWTNFTPTAATYTIAISVLFGVYCAMLIYSLRRRIRAARGGDLAMSVMGIASGVLGIGCASCGSLILLWGLSVLGAAGAFALLPFGGMEFGILGVVLLIISIHLIAKQIQNPLVCKA